MSLKAFNNSVARQCQSEKGDGWSTVEMKKQVKEVSISPCLERESRDEGTDGKVLGACFYGSEMKLPTVC